MIKPATLKPGDTIGLVSPSSGLANLVPHRVERAVKALEGLGFKVRLSANALSRTGYTSSSPEARAWDLMDMFLDPEIRAIVTMIGGNHANQILKLLDYAAIKNNPKIFCGYSDITVLHLALQTQADLVTFYGPAALTQFGENPEPQTYTVEYFNKALCTSQPIGRITPSSTWTDEVLNWLEKKDLERPRILKPNPGWSWLKPGYAQGQISGGCISSLMHLRGTPYWPDWKNKILFWELSESDTDISIGDPPALIDACLADLDNSGTFESISGMVIGRAFGYTDDRVSQLMGIIKARTEKYSFPILYGVDIGHTDPIMTIPCGLMSTLDSENDVFSIDEAATV